MRVDFGELESLAQSLGVALSGIPESVKRRMLRVVSEKIGGCISKNAKRTGMLQGPYNADILAQSVRIKERGGYMEINFAGAQHGNRNAEVAFVNEYGKTQQAARPFIARAIEQGMDEAMPELENILLDYVEDILLR